MDELCHYGIKGQKWGVRRFQNSDGSYTSEGKRRAQQEKKDPVKEMKDEDLRKAINRLSGLFLIKSQMTHGRRSRRHEHNDRRESC